MCPRSAQRLRTRPIEPGWPGGFRACRPEKQQGDLTLIDSDDRLLSDLALSMVKRAKQPEADTCYRLQSVPGLGKFLALGLLYAMHDIDRFPRVQDFVSYCRFVNVPKNPQTNATAPPVRRLERLSQMGVFRSGRSVLTRQSCGSEVSRPLGEKAWQGAGLNGARP